MAKAPARKRLLLVEDEAIIALAIQAHIQDMGLETIGPVCSTRAARDVLNQERPDYVLLDYLLTDGSTESLAEMLRAQGIPFAWMTGCSRWDMPAGHEPILQKPWDPQTLRQLLASISQPAIFPVGAE